jgi:hypothetical protein
MPPDFFNLRGGEIAALVHCSSLTGWSSHFGRTWAALLIKLQFEENISVRAEFWSEIHRLQGVLEPLAAGFGSRALFAAMECTCIS